MPEAAAPISADTENGPITEGVFGGAAIASWSADADGTVASAPITVIGPVSRVGVWLEVLGATTPSVDVRAGWANGQTGPWVRMAALHSEATHRVLGADLDTAATVLQFRALASEIANIQTMRWVATVPLTPQALSGAVVDPTASSPVLPRSDWAATAARCGATDTIVERVTLHTLPGPSAGGDPTAFLRALQAFDRGGRGWCDVRASYLVTSTGVFMGRGSNRTGLGDGQDGGRVAVAMVGCTTDPESQSNLRHLLTHLITQGKLTAADQLSATVRGTCDDAAWVDTTVIAWLDTDPFAVAPPPPPPPPPMGGRIIGKVWDASTGSVTDGTAVVGARVNCDCGESTTTDAAGAFALTVNAGMHVLTVTKADFVTATRSVDVAAGSDRVVDVALEPVDVPSPGISVIDHSFLIDHWGGNDVDPMGFPETQDGFQAYLDGVGVTHFAAWEYVVPNNQTVADRCGFTILLPDRSMWRRAAALGLLADELRELVDEPVTLRNWWRPPCYNQGVGGAANGDHPDGDALDLDFRSERSRADAQRHLCDAYWRRDIVDAGDIAPGSNLDPRLNMSIGLGGATIHLGLLSRNGRRYWKYSSYSTLSNSGNCW